MAEKIRLDENEDLLVSTEQLCKLFGVSRAAINKWVSSGCPKHSRGWFLLKDVLNWKGDNVAEKTKGTSAKAKKTFFEARYKEEQVKALEFKNNLQEGLYLDKESAETELKRLLIILKTSLLGMATTISTELALYVDTETARSLDAQIKNIIDDALNQMRIDGIYEQRRINK